MLNSLITSKTKRNLLVLFFTNPYKKFYIRELSREIGQQPALIRRELIRLEKTNILSSKKVANLSYYYVNRECPLYKELKNIILKTEGVIGSIRSVLKSQEKNIFVAFIYGSYAKGKEKPHSDIDLMVIGNILPEKLIAILRKTEGRLKREINYVIFPKEEFKRKLDKPFIKNVLNRKKIFIVGDENELKRLVEKE